MADDRTDEQKAVDEQRKAEAEALAADPIGESPLDLAREREAEEAEPLGYVDPEAQKEPEAAQPAKKATSRKAGVTRDDTKEGSGG